MSAACMLYKIHANQLHPLNASTPTASVPTRDIQIASNSHVHCLQQIGCHTCQFQWSLCSKCCQALEHASWGHMHCEQCAQIQVWKVNWVHTQWLRVAAALISITLAPLPRDTGLESINQSKGAYDGGHVASPTLWRQTQGFLRASLHAGPLPILRMSWQYSSTCSSRERCGRPLGGLHTVLSRTNTTWWAGLNSG